MKTRQPRFEIFHATILALSLVAVFPASGWLPGVDPIRPPHNGLPLALMRYLQILLGHRPWTHGADGPHLFEDSLPLFFQSSRSIEIASDQKKEHKPQTLARRRH